ncbi:MAG: hypothetical protein KBD37_05255 [Burkholderiales bacterium]|nr:hypothetical protein [Burkholderiales bacterium]
MRILSYTILVALSINAHAYTQTDLLNAQTNFQVAKSNLDNNQSKYDGAQSDVRQAESSVQNAKKNLEDAQKNLKIKRESEVVAKRELDTATNVYKQSGNIVNSIWEQVNGNPMKKQSSK